ncbi:hypothetical protein CONPUDRAFT_112209 [Coniophora puteana RWD-64-598 SS2]|uniref:FAD/NAD(P)-binding domain-containing protein n=1 Tax=Coniophora puteana (strain RWD-64-598) TaxID=741705 RepID=A0A5M3M9X3_CONPW|nr:uncharacterized protein CONPUDRAFT_112209 [Coniophora puteana RWD-64-598 SS2]EIW75654.1 hypothetical protein CONPUDRAFT_112209 [Coniophora puteana RWD-64-598 SS2]
MSAAYALSLHPDKFAVTIFEQSADTGGMATSIPIDGAAYGAEYINDGVQGASPVFYNTYAMFDKLGFSASPVGMQVSFGRDKDTEFWSNVFPSRVIDKFGPDIKKFGRVLKFIKTFEPLFAVISVQAMLKMFRFSKASPIALIRQLEDFGETIVYPLVALFFGTGNQTPFISSAILERVFMDPNMRLYSPDSFLASIPDMRAFPRLSELYGSWSKEVTSRGNVDIRTSRQVTRILRGRPVEGSSSKATVSVQVFSQSTAGLGTDQKPKEPFGPEERDEFDELIMACDADSALKILGKQASWMERKVLGNVKYLWDISVTHNDVEYMEKYYRLRYSPDLKSSRTDDDAKKGYELAEKEFSPLYFIRSYPSDKKKIEMSFDLTNYQAQFKGEHPRGPLARTSPAETGEDGSPPQPPSSSPPLEKHVFQTIFLDRDGSEELWSRDDVDTDKVIYEKWWKQQSHRWQHYAGTVPWMMMINGKHHTRYAGAWSVLNMHEIAVVSGFAAAYQLGADYPFSEDENCKRLFRLYLGLSHGSRMRAEDRKGFFA